MSLLIVSLFITYMLFNIYTDFLYLKTKGYWHLIFLVLCICLGVMAHIKLLDLMCVVCVSLVIGILRENMKLIRFSPGDTKMIIVASLFCFLISPEEGVLYTVLMVHIAIFMCSSILTGFITLLLLFTSFIRFKTITGYHSVKFKKMNISLVTDGWKVTRMYYCLPAAISVLGGVIPLILMSLK
ncbi:hypothetical protein BTT_64190 (plasmid) [Bacillus thuringiensis serovar morrisoni str. 4AA1]|nr:membrane protein [Bacillus thuringiensis serovar morrisoni]MRA99549.1 hypothetical protein [Bacillus thuringiensis]OTY38018.1 hypothetical protein BK736_18385 [Bacillus thuringiensis serovar poloniensis]RUR60769.1 hypothetical protein ELS81_24615 [Bacillus sp. VKPM B-3276]UOC05166.1 hypothetical protein BTT_64190 [Bacillus thuringiensis serovar morrisoni str. 4AA1]